MKCIYFLHCSQSSHHDISDFPLRAEVSQNTHVDLAHVLQLLSSIGLCRRVSVQPLALGSDSLKTLALLTMLHLEHVWGTGILAEITNNTMGIIKHNYDFSRMSLLYKVKRSESSRQLFNILNQSKYK